MTEQKNVEQTPPDADAVDMDTVPTDTTDVVDEVPEDGSEDVEVEDLTNPPTEEV